MSRTIFIIRSEKNGREYVNQRYSQSQVDKKVNFLRSKGFQNITIEEIEEEPEERLPVMEIGKYLNNGMTLNEGDRVFWQDREGTFIEMTGSKKNVRYVSGTHAKVKFDGNKTISKVPIDELKKISQ